MTQSTEKFCSRAQNPMTCNPQHGDGKAEKDSSPQFGHAVSASQSVPFISLDVQIISLDVQITSSAASVASPAAAVDSHGGLRSSSERPAGEKRSLRRSPAHQPLSLPLRRPASAAGPGAGGDQRDGGGRAAGRMAGPGAPGQLRVLQCRRHEPDVQLLHPETGMAVDRVVGEGVGGGGGRRSVPYDDEQDG